MNSILLLSHGELSKEILKTAELILGKVENVDCLTLPVGTDITQYEKNVSEKIREAKGGILILTDLFGGTPFITVSGIYNSMENNENVEVVTGMNLIMVLQSMSIINEVDIHSLKREAMKYAAEGIVDLKAKVVS